MPLKLYYFHDPMCSWCWAFTPVWQDIVAGLPESVCCQRILGGLAPETDRVMPREMQIKLRGIWQKIQQTVPGTPFNFDFWEKCIPRRSTYPACRAVIAARRQGLGFEESMILAIQRAYYLEARNPSDISTLIELANEIGLKTVTFKADIDSSVVHEALLTEIAFTQQQNVHGFPTLSLEKDGVFTAIPLNHHNFKDILQQINTRSQQTHK